MTLRILAVCGSLQARSSNLDLLSAASKAAAAGVEVVLFDGIRDLPLFNPDLEAETPPAAVHAWRRALAESDAVLIASPEYGFSLPGALKNAIDWTIGSGELDRKIVALTANVNHVERGRRGLSALRDTLVAVNASIVADEPILRGPTFEAGVAALVSRLVTAARERHPFEADNSRGDTTSAPTGHIVAMGGGGFSMEPDNPLLDDFVLSLSPRTPARVCFLPTASAEAAAYIVRFYRAFSGRCLPSDLTLFDPPALPRRPSSSRGLAEFVAQQDIFYVGGGNTLHLLALWRAHGLDQHLRDAWARGAVLCGVSAGMNCWFRASMTDSYGGVEPLQDGLGLLEGSACPHYDGESARRPAYHRALLGGLPAGYAADDGAALHFAGTSLVEAVSSRRAARVYRVQAHGEQVIEELVPTRFLGA